MDSSDKGTTASATLPLCYSALKKPLPLHAQNHYQLPSTTYQLPQTRKEHNMKLEIDWLEMAKAVAKAIWPFIAGAFGGLFSGCTFGGIGPNFI